MTIKNKQKKNTGNWQKKKGEITKNIRNLGNLTKITE